jgi:crotonobetainyl-CoA:carnitine CoA-transferase CaiB-like acyl-CoA transferase
MDHTGGYCMAIAILMALLHRARTGEGQWVDMSCTEAGAALTGPAILDWTVNRRPMRRPGSPHSNRSEWPPMAPHGIYPARGEDCWIAIACRDSADWAAFAGVVDRPFVRDARFADLAGRLAAQDALDDAVAAWTRELEASAAARALVVAGVPAAVVARPEERIEHDANTAAWGLWPEVEHRAIGRVRVDGLPVHLSRTDWSIARGAPCLGEHNDQVFGELLGLAPEEIDALRADGDLMPGPLEGLRVLELAHERTAFAGKLLADAGADVRLLEPRDGCAQRATHRSWRSPDREAASPSGTTTRANAASRSISTRRAARARARADRARRRRARGRGSGPARGARYRCAFRARTASRAGVGVDHALRPQRAARRRAGD